jgi:hypothetical protein
MPDAKGILTVEEREKCSAWFNEHSSGKVECPICKNNQWDIEDHLVKTHILIPGQRSIEGVLTYSFFMVCCRKCRHTIFINAVDSKIVGNRPADPSLFRPQPDA